MTTQIKTTKKLTRQLSLSVGLLSFSAFIIQGLGSTWGFQTLAEQITQTILLFSGAINVFFLGSTTEKSQNEKKD